MYLGEFLIYLFSLKCQSFLDYQKKLISLVVDPLNEEKIITFIEQVSGLTREKGDILVK